MNRGWIWGLRDEGDKGVVHLFQNKTTSKKRLDHGNDFFANRNPIGFVRNGWHSIRTRGFWRSKTESNGFNFIIRGNGIQGFIFFRGDGVRDEAREVNMVARVRMLGCKMIFVEVDKAITDLLVARKPWAKVIFYKINCILSSANNGGKMEKSCIEVWWCVPLDSWFLAPMQIFTDHAFIEFTHECSQ